MIQIMTGLLSLYDYICSGPVTHTAFSGMMKAKNPGNRAGMMNQNDQTNDAFMAWLTL